MNESTPVLPLLVPGANGAGSVSVHSPYDGRQLATLVAADAQAVEQALSTAYALFRDRQQWLSASHRVSVLRRTAELMQEQSEELALQIALEGGKPLTDARIEVKRAIDGIQQCSELQRNTSGSEIPMHLDAASDGRLAFTSHEPIGVVIAVSAFNHPLNLIVHQIGPAIAAGCPVIVKPAEDTPLSCYRLVSLLHEAGLPAEWCQALVVDEVDNATRLVSDQRAGFFSFIGSAKVGWMLRSKLAPGTRCALEHGGAAPVLIAADADLNRVGPALVKGGFYHAGQVCVSVQRVFVEQALADQLAATLVKEVAKLKIGDPTLADTEVGPLIRKREVDRVAEWVEEAIAAGAKLLCGGKRLGDSCYAPTILFDPPDQCRVSHEEIFGPVICIYPVASLDDALQRANSLPVAFQAAVMTRDVDTALHCARRLDASAVMINDHTAFRVDWMPFAGLRQSGLGTGGIPYSFHDMQIEKLVVMNSPGLR